MGSETRKGGKAGLAEEGNVVNRVVSGSAGFGFCLAKDDSRKRDAVGGEFNALVRFKRRGFQRRMIPAWCAVKTAHRALVVTMSSLEVPQFRRPFGLPEPVLTSLHVPRPIQTSTLISMSH